MKVQAFKDFEIVAVGVFTVEYVLRFFTHFGVRTFIDSGFDAVTGYLTFSEDSGNIWGLLDAKNHFTCLKKAW